MPFTIGRCPLCGSEMSIPEGMEECYCLSCGKKVAPEAPAILSGNKGESEASEQTRTIPVQALASSGSTPSASNEGGVLFLDAWKTSGGMVVFGIILSYALNVVLVRAPGVAFDVLGCVFAVYVIIYALAIYPSLFGEKSKLKSSTAVSFLNGFSGGLIFGPLWCASLTKGKRGISQYVLTAILVIGLVAALLLSFGVFGNNGTSGAGSNAEMQEQEYEAANQEILSHPEKYLESGRVRTIVSKRLTYSGDWNVVKPAFKRLTFGCVYQSSRETSWYPESSGNSYSSTEAASLMELAIDQMCGDLSEGQKIWQEFAASPNTRTMEALIYVGPFEFMVDGETYYCAMFGRLQKDGNPMYDSISISTSPQW